MVFVFLCLTSFTEAYSLGLAMLLQMAKFHSFLGLSNIPLCVCVCVCVCVLHTYIHIFFDIIMHSDFIF